VNRGARVENAQSAFDRALARQTGVTGLRSTQTGDAQKLKELQELARRNRIDERLAQLKARLTK
jgi:phage shock protein A